MGWKKGFWSQRGFEVCILEGLGSCNRILKGARPLSVRLYLGAKEDVRPNGLWELGGFAERSESDMGKRGFA